jgi:hypothetical protein
MKTPLRIGIAIGIIVILVVALVMQRSRSFGAPALFGNQSAASSTAAQDNAPAGMHLYQNVRYHFSLIYPQELIVQEYAEPGDALTVTFTDAENTEAFEVYATPYNDKQITKTRFKRDEPSGVQDQPTDVMVDGVRATMFFGKNTIMGDTREVWFIRSGILYEVTTYKELDPWLANIMNTWKFI